VLLEVQEPLLELGQGKEVIGSEHLSLDNGEVNFDLVEPTSVDGCRFVKLIPALRAWQAAKTRNNP
jgi:hypothetical protein